MIRNDNTVHNEISESKNGISENSALKLEGKFRKSFSQRITYLIKNITLEPIIIFYLFPLTFTGIAGKNLDFEKACRVNLNYSSEICDDLINLNLDNITEEVNNVQSLIATMAAWSGPFGAIVPTVVILFVGAWSDRTYNRKICIIIPLAGQVLAEIATLIGVYFFLQLPLEYNTISGTVISSLSGGRAVMFMGWFSYIADVTSVDERTFRIGILGFFSTMSVAAGNALSGVLTIYLGYYGIFTLAMIFYALGLLYTCEYQFIYMYAIKKFNFTAVQYSIFMTVWMIIGTVGTISTIALLSKKFKIDDSIVGGISLMASGLAVIVFALAPTWEWFYVGTLVDFCGKVSTTCARSITTKIVDADEIGKLNSLYGVVEAIVPIIYVPIYSKLYIDTIEQLPGAFYLLSAVFFSLGFFLFIIIYKITRITSS